MSEGPYESRRGPEVTGETWSAVDARDVKARARGAGGAAGAALGAPVDPGSPASSGTPLDETWSASQLPGLRSTLPREWLMQARPRVSGLAVMMMLVAGVLMLGLVLARYGFAVPEVQGTLGGVRFGLAAAVLVGSAAMWVMARDPRVTPTRLCDLGLGYEVLAALSFALGRYALPMPPEQLPSGLSPVCIVILLFPLIVPSTPGKHAVVALLAASTEWLSLLIWSEVGHPVPSASLWPVYVAPNYLCALLAVLPARLLYRIGQEAARARELGSYALVEQLGEGGMGEVWRARHQMLARPAAIKLIRPERIAAADLEGARRTLHRFEREAQITAQLRSPHTIDIYDFGTTDEGVFYYVMELLDGLDLEALVRRFGPLPPARVVYLLRQACESLADAHACGLIHRDIKPANIYVCRYGRALDFVKVLDFGLVTYEPAKHAGASRLTADNTVPGTPAYIAPEMALASDALDGRADLYALGCVGYWMLTGELLFEARSPMEMLVKHIQEPPPPLAARVEGEVPAGLEAIIMACLAKAPEERPESAEEMASALDALALSEPWSVEHARRWWTLHIPSAAAVGHLETPEHIERLQVTHERR